MKRIVLFTALLIWSIANTVSAQRSHLTALAKGAKWHYSTAGKDVGDLFRYPYYSELPVYTEEDWKEAYGSFGYGETVNTTLDYGTDPNNKTITTYFYSDEMMIDYMPYDIDSFYVSVNYDDGFVVYVNGVEVLRRNMPMGRLTVNTLASSEHRSGSYEKFDLSMYRALLHAGNGGIDGTNQIAVEVHQSAVNTEHAFFDMEVIYTYAKTKVPVNTLLRGPYLNLGTANSMVVRWRTNGPMPTVLQYGTAAGNYTEQYIDNTPVTEHIAKLQNLNPETKYFYNIAGLDVDVNDVQNQFFITSPVEKRSIPTRIWVMGDFGNGLPTQQAALSRYLVDNVGKETNLWLWVGDNAYQSGTDQQYQDYVFTTYKEQLKNHILWPSAGNHDMESCKASKQEGPYYDIFSLPKNGEAGGVPSGTESYYSFNYGDIHFIILESTQSDKKPTGPMLEWMKKDLAANTAKWTIAFWHHPPYSFGSHNSDDEGGLIDMRQYAVSLLEAGGVDLVLTGHSHSYERSYLLDSHYGKSETFDENTMLPQGKDNGQGDQAYHKPVESPYSHKGAVYVVMGTSGSADASVSEHPANYVSTIDIGSLVLEVNGDTLRETFLDVENPDKDSFVIIKDLKNIPCQIDLDLGKNIDTCGPGPFILDAGAGFKSYEWSDGSTAQQAPATKTGWYTVRVAKSATCSKTAKVYVHSSVLAGFQNSLDVAKVNQLIAFNDTTKDVRTWYWDFGDGTSSTLKNPTHSFTTDGIYPVRLTVFDGACTRTGTKNIVVGNVTGISADATALDFKIFPNPAHGEVMVDLTLTQPQDLDLSLVDVSGKTVRSIYLEKATGEVQQSVSLAGLTKGVYFLSIRSPYVHKVEKLTVF